MSDVTPSTIPARRLQTRGSEEMPSRRVDSIHFRQDVAMRGREKPVAVEVISRSPGEVATSSQVMPRSSMTRFALNWPGFRGGAIGRRLPTTRTVSSRAGLPEGTMAWMSQGRRIFFPSISRCVASTRKRAFPVAPIEGSERTIPSTRATCGAPPSFSASLAAEDSRVCTTCMAANKNATAA